MATRTHRWTLFLIGTLLLGTGSAAAQTAASEPTCEPGTLQARANEDGSITLTWEPFAEHVYGLDRRESGGDWEFVTLIFSETEHTDTNTTAGTTYEYRLRGLAYAKPPSPPPGGYPAYCVEVTAVPLFATPLLGTLAAVGGVAAYAATRRSGGRR